MQVGMWYAPYFATFQKRPLGRGAVFGQRWTHHWGAQREMVGQIGFSCEGLKPVPPRIWLLLQLLLILDRCWCLLAPPGEGRIKAWRSQGQLYRTQGMALATAMATYCLSPIISIVMLCWLYMLARGRPSFHPFPPCILSVTRGTKATRMESN